MRKALVAMVVVAGLAYAGWVIGQAPPPPPPAPPKLDLPPQPVGPPPPPPIPPIPLELVGLHTMPDGRPLATLKDKSGAVFQALEGQIVDGRYRLVKVGTQSVVVARLDGSNPRTLVVR